MRHLTASDVNNAFEVVTVNALYKLLTYFPYHYRGIVSALKQCLFSHQFNQQNNRVRMTM